MMSLCYTMHAYKVAVLGQVLEMPQVEQKYPLCRFPDVQNAEQVFLTQYGQDLAA